MLAFNDIERIEVLKGPQGTLFGRNSAAGAISIVTTQPSQEFDSMVRGRFGEFGKQYYEGMLNTPLGEKLALRINGVYNKSDGWMQDAATGEDLMPEENWAGRAALRWELSDKTSATLSWDHDNLDQLARPAIGLVAIDSGQAPYPADAATYLDPRKAPIYNDVVGNEESRKLDQVNLFIDHSFGYTKFHSSTSLRQFDTENREDEDGTNLINSYFVTANVESNESFYQEFKLSGATPRLDWVAGVSYYNEKADQVSDTQTYTDSVDTLGVNLGLYEANGIPFPLYGFTSSVIEPFGVCMLGLPWREAMYNRGDFTAYAAFGDVIWHMNDKINLTVGLRYTQDKKEFTWINGSHETPELDAVVAGLEQAGFFDQFPVPPEAYRFADIAFQGDTPVGGVTKNDSWDDVSPRVVLDIKVAPDVMWFGSIAKGYKAGGYNSVQVNSAFENEDVWNFETGVKSRVPECGRGAECLDVLLRLQEQAGARARDRHRGLRTAAVPGRHQRRTGLGPGRRCDVEGLRSLHPVRQRRVHQRDVQGQHDAGDDPVDLSGEPTGGAVPTPRWGGSRMGAGRRRATWICRAVRVSRRVALQRGLPASGYLPGHAELQGRRSHAASRHEIRLDA